MKSNTVLESVHPSPLSAYNGFGSKHFQPCNEYISKGIQAIDWNGARNRTRADYLLRFRALQVLHYSCKHIFVMEI